MELTEDFDTTLDIHKTQSVGPLKAAPRGCHDSKVFRFSRNCKDTIYKDVIDGDYLDLSQYKHTIQADGTLNLESSCYVPDSCLQDLRIVDSHISMDPQPLVSRSTQKPHIRLLNGLTALEFVGSFGLEDEAQEVGIDIFHSYDGFSYTSIIYNLDDSNVIIDRHAANRKKGLDTHPKIAPLTLLLQNDRKTATIRRECLKVHIFYDRDLLEVFVNDRVAISTRVYPESGMCFGVNSWIGDCGSARMLSFQLWELSLGGRELKL